MVTADELRQLIDTVWDAVQASKAGPIAGTTPDGQPGLREPGWRTFLVVVGQMVPHTMTTDCTMKEPPESWQEG